MNKDYYVHPSSVIDEDVKIGKGSKIWHFSHLMPRSEIGSNTVIGQNVYVAAGVVIGKGCKIQNNVSLYEGITIEDDVFCGPSCVFTNVINPRSFIERKDEFKPTLLKKGCSIGANATIVCGSTIGEYALVAAGAVITSDVGDFKIYAGVPAKHIGYISISGRTFDLDIACKKSGKRFAYDDLKSI